VWLLAACVSVGTPVPVVTPTPSPTVTPTATVVWFPPTETPTPRPTQAPTPTSNPLAGLGQRILFDALRQPDRWTVGVFPAGEISVGADGMTFAVSVPKGMLSTRQDQPVLTDFFAQVVASPSLCMGEDQYGILFRAQGEGDFYRFLLTCDGRARLDLVLGGRLSVVQALTPSPVVPPGAPATVTLAVRVEGKRIQTFVEGVQLFEVEVTGPRNGTIGLFARAAGETPVTVTFSDLAVYTLP